MAALATDKECGAVFVKAETYLLVRDVLNEFQEDVSVVRESYRALLQFSVEAACVERLQEGEILKLSSAILHRYLDEAELVTDLITFITVFAAKDEWLEEMGALGLVNKTVIVMSRHSEDRAAVLSGVHLLRAMHREVVRSAFEGSNVVMQLIECAGKYLLDLER